MGRATGCGGPRRPGCGESDGGVHEGPAPTGGVDSGAAGVHPAQARARRGRASGAATRRPTDSRAAVSGAAAPRPAGGCGDAGAAPPASTRRGAGAGSRAPGGGPASSRRVVGHGHKQSPGLAAHTRGVQTAGLVPLPADGLQAPVLNPIAAGIQGGAPSAPPGCRSAAPRAASDRRRATPRCRPEAGRGRLARCPPTVSPGPAISCAPVTLGLAPRLKCDSAGRGQPSHNLRPQVPTAQPLAEAPHRSRHGGSQLAQQAAEMVNPGPLGLCTHDVPGPGWRAGGRPH